MKKQMYIIEDENNSDEGRRFLPVEEVRSATIGDMLNGGYNYDYCGYEYNNDTDMYTDIYDDEKKEMTLEEMEKIDMDDFQVVAFWDGNNMKTEIFESSELGYSVDVEIEQLENPKPAYYHRWKLKFGNEEIIATTSNMSGSISPYYEEEIS